MAADALVWRHLEVKGRSVELQGLIALLHVSLLPGKGVAGFSNAEGSVAIHRPQAPVDSDPQNKTHGLHIYDCLESCEVL